ncbi:DNA polymerase III subunit delta [Virgibacillus xinjiangensis]|uniref:DNA polymerase III subunit delta n=1 Tax=Virgibacillus xinjiangensis TaxID=393090 RepID=A0ABV7CS21_9BACI
MSYMETVTKVKKGQLSPVYLLYGTENYFIHNLEKLISSKVLGEEKENLAVYDLEEIPIQEVLGDVETYPFFGEKKLVFAHNPAFLKAKPERMAVEHDLHALERYLENPVDYSVLVLIAPYEKFDERKKISKLLKKSAEVAVCNPVKEYEVPKWINELSKQFNITIAEDAYEIFETELSSNLQLLESELSKLALYVGENGKVTRDIAENLVSHTTDASSLRLVDAVIEKDLAKAISIYKDLEKMKEEPIALIGLLSFQFRTIFRVKLLKMKGYSQAQMQKQLSVHPYVVKIAANREKQFSIERLKLIMDELAIADERMKQGGMEKGLAFEMLLYQLISPIKKA